MVSTQSTSDATRCQGCRLVPEGGLGGGRVERSDRCQDLAGGPDGARHDDRPRCRVGRLPRHPRRCLVELLDPGLGGMQLQPVGVAAEAVGQDDVGARVDELAMEVDHTVGVVDVPELGAVAGFEAAPEEARAHAAIGQEHAALVEQRAEQVGHRVSPSRDVPRPSPAAVAGCRPGW
jgi:hypothetical protein